MEKIVDALDILKLQVIDDFTKLCKQLSNGYYADCYQDILTKIMLIENTTDIKDFNKYLYQFI